MLQDLTHGRLENEFYNRKEADYDLVICVKNNKFLVNRKDRYRVTYPTVATVRRWAEENNWNAWGENHFQYVFRMQDVNYFLWMGEGGKPEDESFGYEDARALSAIQTKDVCFAAYTAKHLYVWYKNHRFCGACQAPTVHDKKERMLRCPKCGNMIFPTISPAVIIAVTNGDKLLLSKYAGGSGHSTRYAMIAGYAEIGETIEETVKREVMEEVGLKVKNIRYYKSQPWGRDGAVLMGFYCDLDGSDKIHIDRKELSLAEWHDRYMIPAHDDGISLTREMIRVFEEGREPK